MSSEEEAPLPTAGDFEWVFETEAQTAVAKEKPRPRYIEQLRRNAEKRKARKLDYREALALKQSDSETRVYTTGGYAEAMKVVNPGKEIAAATHQATFHSSASEEEPGVVEVSHQPTAEDRQKKLAEARARYEQRRNQRMKNPGC